MEEFHEKKVDAVQRYVNLLSNSGFKAVFGDCANKDVVMSIMNSFLPPHRHVSDIEYSTTEHQGQMLSNKEYRYDFMCRGKDGVSFIVEMQCYPNAYWFQRCVSYASRAYDRQNERGGDYNVPPVYLIGLMGTELSHGTSETWEDRYISEYTFMETTSHELQSETIIIIFAELARFSKSLETCGNDLEKMLYVLKNMGNLRNQPESLKHEIFTRIFRACEIAMFNEDKRIQYDRDMYDEKRRMGELKTAEMIGLEKGRVEGREEGREEATLEAAMRFKKLGVAVEIISQATGLTADVIDRL